MREHERRPTRGAPRRRLARAVRPLRPGGLAAAVALAVALSAVALAAVPYPAAPAATGQLWQPELEGLYGDVVLDVALTGRPPQVGRWMLLLSSERPLHRVRDEGDGWDPVLVDPDRPAAAVHSVAVARDDETGQTLFAGLAGRTRFARSEDGGRTWTARSGPVALDRIDRLTTSEASGRVYAAQADKAVLMTSVTDGEAWSQDPLPGASGTVKALFTSDEDAMVYMVRGDVLYGTLDVPAAWTLLLRPDPVAPVTAALAVDLAAIGPRGRLHAAGRLPGGGYAVRSSPDRGSTWIAEGWPEGATDVAASALAAGDVRPGLNGIWLALQDGRVYQSDDLGRTWSLIAELPIRATRVVADPHTLEVWVGTDGLGLVRVRPAPAFHTGAVSVDALSVEITPDITRTLVTLLARVLPERRDMGATQPELLGLFESEGAGAWTRRALTTGLGSELLASPLFTYDRTLYSGRKVSTDGGDTWRDLQMGPSGRAPYVIGVGPLTATLPVVYAVDEPYAGVAGGSGLVLSEDGGLTWRATEGVAQGIVDVVASPGFPDDRTALLVTAGGFVYGSQDGLTFRYVSRVPSYDPIERNVYDLALSPDFPSDGIALAVVEDPLASPRANIYFSNNAGRTWQPRTGGLDGSCRPRSITLSPGFGIDRVVFLGTERRDSDPPLPGLFGSDTGGADWFPESYLGTSVVRDFAWLGGAGSGKLFAAAGVAGLLARDLSEPIGSRKATASITPTRVASATASATGSASPATDEPGTHTTTPSPSVSPTRDESTVEATTPPVETPTGPATASTVEATDDRTPEATSSASATVDGTPTSAPTGRLFLPAAVKRR